MLISSFLIIIFSEIIFTLCLWLIHTSLCVICETKIGRNHLRKKSKHLLIDFFSYFTDFWHSILKWIGDNLPFWGLYKYTLVTYSYSVYTQMLRLCWSFSLSNLYRLNIPSQLQPLFFQFRDWRACAFSTLHFQWSSMCHNFHFLLPRDGWVN